MNEKSKSNYVAQYLYFCPANYYSNMKHNKIILLALPLLLAGFASFTILVSDSEKDLAIDQNLMHNLDNLHYQPRIVNDHFSEMVYDLYLKRIDASKKFLIQEDVNALEKYKHSIDDDINAGKFSFFEKSLELLNKRIDEAQNYYKEILDKPFDFTKDETIETDADKLKFAKNKEELKDAWRKSLKYSVLSRVYEAMESQEKAHEKSDTVKLKSREELEADARKKVLKADNDYFKRLHEISRKDRLSHSSPSMIGTVCPFIRTFKCFVLISTRTYLEVVPLGKGT